MQLKLQQWRQTDSSLIDFLRQGKLGGERDMNIELLPLRTTAHHKPNVVSRQNELICLSLFSWSTFPRRARWSRPLDDRTREHILILITFAQSNFEKFSRSIHLVNKLISRWWNVGAGSCLNDRLVWSVVK